MRSRENKKALAKKLGISRSSLYYHSLMNERDEVWKEKIMAVLSIHPSYGHRRIALCLGCNKKRILRVMKKFGIKPYRRRSQRPVKPGDRSLATYRDQLGQGTVSHSAQRALGE